MKPNLLIFISGAAMIFSVAFANSEDLTKTQRSHSSQSRVAHSSGSDTSSTYSSGYTASKAKPPIAPAEECAPMTIACLFLMKELQKAVELAFIKRILRAIIPAPEICRNNS